MNEARRQCASCPFREDADELFADFLRRTIPPAEAGDRTSAELVAYYRERSRTCALDRANNFACHDTTYDRRGGERPFGRWRLCKGAQEYREALVGSEDAA